MKIQTNQKLSKESLALSVTPGVVGYTDSQVAEMRSAENIPSRIRNIKSDALFALSVDVVNTVRTGESAIAAQSVLLSKVLENNLFLTEGYENFKQFAESVYGLNGATAYQRAKVGGNIIGNNKIPAAIRRMPVSTLERMTTLSEQDLLEAINDGKITPDMGQFAVRDAVREIKSASASTKPDKPKTAFPVVVEMFLNGEWTITNNEIHSEFNLKSIAANLTGTEWTGLYTKFPGEIADKSELHAIFENVDSAWYHLRVTKAVTKSATDKTAKTLIPISAAEYAKLALKVGTGEIKASELANFTIIVEN